MNRREISRNAPALLLAATAFFATPGLAQDAAPAASTPQTAPAPVNPPRVVPTLPENSAVTQNGQSASPTPVNAEAAAQAAAEEAERRPARAAPRRETTRSAPRATVPARQAVVPTTPPAPAPVATPAPVTTPAPAPVAATPEPATANATDGNEAAADETVTNETAATDTTQQGGAPIWPWILAAIVVIGGAIAFFARRRREEPVYEEPYAEPAHVEPTPVADPVAAPVIPVVAPIAAAGIAAVATDDPAEPVAAEDATLAPADQEDVAALTAGTPAGDRPWLEFALRPLRAGTNADEALVEIELTVGNAGPVTARDVRIATYLLESDGNGDLARLLAEPIADGAVEPVTIAPGEGTRVDATLALLKVNMGGTAFLPIVVADARYTLDDGGEGRTSAAFQIGLPGEGGALAPMEIDRPHLYDEVEARLYRQPEHD